MDIDYFTVWVESQEFVDPPEDEDFLNVVVTSSSKVVVGLTVWSHDFFTSEISHWMEGDYFLPPDLVVRDMTESSIREVVSKLIVENDWLSDRGICKPRPGRKK